MLDQYGFIRNMYILMAMENNFEYVFLFMYILQYFETVEEEEEARLVHICLLL